MRSGFLKIIFRARTLLREDGQDLVEYALVIGLLVLAATAGTRTFAANSATPSTTWVPR